MWKPENILVISPHADDMELGAGGTIKKWIEESVTCYSIIFSTLSQPEIRLSEITTSHNILGIPPENTIIYYYANRNFSEHRQNILQDLIDFDIHPDIVLTPTTFDEHQDHQVVCAEVKRAFKKSTILGYEDPWNSTSFNLPMIVRLKKKHIEAKIKAAMSHKSQLHRPYMSKDFINGLAAVRGAIVGVPFAEAFEVIKWIN